MKMLQVLKEHQMNGALIFNKTSICNLKNFYFIKLGFISLAIKFTVVIE
ncbi:MAG: hypothetical protein RLZZ361_294 [Cyanobacteriota bacterium]